MKRSLLVCSALVALVGCVVTVGPGGEEFGWLTGQNVDSQAEFQRRIQVLGPIAFGQTSTVVTYHDAPRYRAFSIAAQPGDPIDLWVRSPNGNAVAWLLDARFQILARNDDANRGTRDAHIATTVPAGAPVNWYIVFREAHFRDATFTVTLAAKPAPPVNFLTCTIDSDCVAVSIGGCCPSGKKAAVNNSVDAINGYAAAHACNNPHPICPEILFVDKRVPNCNFQTNTCEMVDPGTIHCGGFIQRRHECTQDYHCKLVGVPDVGGTCVHNCNLGAIQCPNYQHVDEDACGCADNPSCGGIAGRTCADPKYPRCVDDPRDSCDPTKGGADCGGLCVPGCVEKVMCKAGSHFDMNRCACVPGLIMEPNNRPVFKPNEKMQQKK